MSILWLVSLNALEVTEKLFEVDWDLKTTTVVDYAVEIKLPPALWEKWQQVRIKKQH